MYYHVQRLGSFALTLGLGLSVSMSPVLAAFPDMAVFHGAEVVPDENLAEMRGRFVTAAGVQFFGLQLYSVWQTGDGQVMSSAVSLGVNFAGAGQSNASARAHFFRETPDTLPDPGELQILPEADQTQFSAPTTAGAGGLETVSGVVQSVQLGGNSNDANNRIQIDVLPTGAGVSSLVPNGPLGDPIEISETYVATANDGIVQSVIVDDNGIGVAVNVPTQGTVLQRITGADFNQIAQHVRLTGNLNSISNQMQIVFGVSGINPATRANLLSALQAINQLQ